MRVGAVRVRLGLITLMWAHVCFIVYTVYAKYVVFFNIYTVCGIYCIYIYLGRVGFEPT